MLMAAGLGTRLRPFTDKVPKPLLPLMGVPMAQFSVDALVHHGVERIVANIHHLPELSRAGIGALEAGQTEICISDESSLLLGSAGGIRKALSLLVEKGRQPFFLMNADMLCEVDLQALAARHFELRRAHGVTVTLAIFPAGPDGGRYREIHVDAQKGLIHALGELQEKKPFFAGVAVIEPEAVEKLPDGAPAEFVPQILRPAVEQGRAGAFLTQGAWFDVGSPLLWREAHFSLIERLATGNIPALWKKRIEAASVQVKKAGWVSKRANLNADLSKWREPFYWSPDSQNSHAVAPAVLGARGVLYGDVPVVAYDGTGIAFDGIWSLN